LKSIHNKYYAHRTDDLWVGWQQNDHNNKVVVLFVVLVVLVLVLVVVD